MPSLVPSTYGVFSGFPFLVDLSTGVMSGAGLLRNHSFVQPLPLMAAGAVYPSSIPQRLTPFTLNEPLLHGVETRLARLRGPKASVPSVTRRFGRHPIMVYIKCMSRTNINIDDKACAAVMRRYHLATKRAAVNFALRALAAEPFGVEEARHLRGRVGGGPRRVAD